MANKALLIIDMQAGSFTPATPRYDTDGVIDRINQLSALFRSSGNQVIFIRHDGSKEGDFFPDSDEWQILPALHRLPVDLCVEKTINDSFYRSDLARILEEMAMNDLYITGCATDFCVDSTIKSALSKDYNITVVKDGHTTADRPHATAKTVIDQHNWVWSEMSPAAYPLKVATCREIIGTIMAEKQED